MGRARRPVFVLLALLCLATVASAQWRRRRAPRPAPAIHNIPYDGQFTFARLKFTTGPGGFYYFGLPAWSHGYPRAEDNLTRILDEVTALEPHVDASNVLALDDPDLDKFPVAYMTEAGYWTMTDEEATAFRACLLKGGFVIFDDFRDDFGNAGWMNFDAQMHRVLLGMRYFDLSPSDPIFHAFYDIDSFDIVPQYYDRGTPVFRAVYEDNDPSKRMMAVVNFNTDISNFWEFSALGCRPVEESNEAYTLGVNYVMYAMTH
jgi:hypothetical protein